MQIQEFFEKATGTISYIVFDQKSRDAVMIDPVMDFDAASGKISENSAELLLAFIKKTELNVHFVLETHAHADHLTGAQVIKRALPKIKVGIGSEITSVQKTFASLLNMESEIEIDGSQFDRLFKDNETFSAGTLSIKVIATPGHTPACLSYLIEDAVFCGDAIFMPDSGTGRCDFPGGNASQLYDSIVNRLYKLPDETRMFVGHDYQPEGRPLLVQSTVGDQKKNNIHLTSRTEKSKFVSFREARDKTLSAPRLLWPSLQVNIAAGVLPGLEGNGRRYLRIPLLL